MCPAAPSVINPTKLQPPIIDDPHLKPSSNDPSNRQLSGYITTLRLTGIHWIGQKPLPPSATMLLHVPPPLRCSPSLVPLPELPRRVTIAPEAWRQTLQTPSWALPHMLIPKLASASDGRLANTCRL